MRRQNIDYSGTRSSDGTRSLSPKRNFFVHEAKNYRLLQYSSFGRDKLPISQKDSHIRDNNQSTTTVLDSIRDKIYTSQEELLIHEMTTSRLLRTRPKRTPIKGVITQEDEDLSTIIVLDKEGSSVHETIKNLDYHSTRRNKSRQPMSKATSQSAVNLKESTIHQNVKSTSTDTRPHKSQRNITVTVQDSGAGSNPLITVDGA